MHQDYVMTSVAADVAFHPDHLKTTETDLLQTGQMVALDFCWNYGGELIDVHRGQQCENKSAQKACSFTRKIKMYAVHVISEILERDL